MKKRASAGRRVRTEVIDIPALPERSAAQSPVVDPNVVRRAAQVRKRQDKFLAVFAGYLTIAGACRAMKAHRKGAYYVSRELVRRWRRDDPAFEARFQELHADSEQMLADATVDDALGDWNEQTQRFIGGNAILKIFMLKALNPTKYRDNANVSGEFKSKGGEVVSFTLNLGDKA